MSLLNNKIFNTEKSDYAGTFTGSIFLGEEPGLFDTVNRNFPQIWEVYKNMKSLDWDEQEFDFRSCNSDFKQVPKAISQCMIRTLAWQWEADSVAARSIMGILAPFISAPEATAAWGRICDNEIVHAATYSEIVRLSFDDPRQVLEEVLQVKEAMSRLKVVSDVMATAYQISHEYALGMRSKDDPEVYDAIFMFVVALYILERVQFMASFAVTFAIAETGVFMPIGKAVQKICQDEYEVHVQMDRVVLGHEMSIPIGKASFERCMPKIQAMLDEVVDSELTWTEYALENDPLPGLTRKKLKDWVLFSAAEVYKFFGLQGKHVAPSQLPLAYMKRWMNIADLQASPQEEQNGQYKVNVMARNDGGKVYDLDF